MMFADQWGCVCRPTTHELQTARAAVAKAAVELVGRHNRIGLLVRLRDCSCARSQDRHRLRYSPRQGGSPGSPGAVMVRTLLTNQDVAAWLDKAYARLPDCSCQDAMVETRVVPAPFLEPEATP